MRLSGKLRALGSQVSRFSLLVASSLSTKNEGLFAKGEQEGSLEEGVVIRSDANGGPGCHSVRSLPSIGVGADHC